MNKRPRPTVVIPADATPENRDHILALHVLAALGEGLCPTCAGDLTPADSDSRGEPTGRARTRCRTCACYWQIDPERQAWTRED